MLHPSYTDLMKVVNQDVEEGATKIVNSRYSIVLATAREQDRSSEERCRLSVQKTERSRFLSQLMSLNKGKIKIIAEDDSNEIEP